MTKTFIKNNKQLFLKSTEYIYLLLSVFQIYFGITHCKLELIDNYNSKIFVLVKSYFYSYQPLFFMRLIFIAYIETQKKSNLNNNDTFLNHIIFLIYVF